VNIAHILDHVARSFACDQGSCAESSCKNQKRKRKISRLTLLPGLEEEDRDLAEVEVDEVLRLVGDIAAEVSANDAVPRGVVLLVELLLDVGGDVLLNVELLHSLGGYFNGVGLHVLGHIGVLNHCLAVSGGHFLLWVVLWENLSQCVMKRTKYGDV
jgi:hypothetical protein